MEQQEEKFFISYKADTTLSEEICHKGIERYSTRKRSKFFPKTEIGIKQGINFLKECKFPITREKSLLFLKPKKEGIKRMNEIKESKRIEKIQNILNEPETLDLNKKNFMSLDAFKTRIENL